MNKNSLGPLAVVLVGVAAFGTMLAFAEQPTLALAAVVQRIHGIPA